MDPLEGSVFEVDQTHAAPGSDTSLRRAIK
jgi:hypothetical protein